MKIVQIAVTSDDGNDTVYALTDDGKIYCYWSEDGEWMELRLPESK